MRCHAKISLRLFATAWKTAHLEVFSSLIKRRNCHGTPDFCVFHGSFLCEQGRTTRGQSPCFLPEDEQITTMLIAEIRQSPSRCHAEELYDNGTTHLVEDAPNGARFLLGFALATFGSARARPITLPCGRFMTTKGTTYAIGQATSNCHKQSKCFYITKQINIKVSIYTNLCVFLQHES